MKTMMDTVLSRVEKMEERHTQRIAEMEKMYLDRLEKLEEDTKKVLETKVSVWTKLRTKCKK